MAKNVAMSVNGEILTIKVDMSKEFGPSASGKTIIIASTEGNVGAPGNDEIKIGLNVYKPRSSGKLVALPVPRQSVYVRAHTRGPRSR